MIEGANNDISKESFKSDIDACNSIPHLIAHFNQSEIKVK